MVSTAVTVRRRSRTEDRGEPGPLFVEQQEHGPVVEVQAVAHLADGDERRPREEASGARPLDAAAIVVAERPATRTSPPR